MHPWSTWSQSTKFCSLSDTNFLFFLKCWPSRLPVVLKAQQEPHSFWFLISVTYPMENPDCYLAQRLFKSHATFIDPVDFIRNIIIIIDRVTVKVPLLRRVGVTIKKTDKLIGGPISVFIHSDGMSKLAIGGCAIMRLDELQVLFPYFTSIL